MSGTSKPNSRRKRPDGIVIIGDRFMRPSAFRQRLSERLDSPPPMHLHELAWPDEPMTHGYAGDDLGGVREFMGDPNALVDIIAGAEILVTQLAPVTAGMLERLPGLRCIAVARGGPVNIDLRAAAARDIRVVNVPGRNASAVAEFTLGAILAETRLIRVGHEALRRGEYRGDLYRADRTGRELCEMTVGLVGYGQVGRRVVSLLKPFGCRILVCDPHVSLSSRDATDGVEHVGFEDLLERADVVSLHARVTDETTGMMNADAFARMRAGSYFINTARGPLCDYAALHRALDAGPLAGAMLETFEQEPPPPDWPLLVHPKVTLTPHIAGASIRTVQVAAEGVAEEVARYLDDRPPLNPAGP